MSAYRGKTQKDEVRDEEGRRRFHGAFTGGFSAGYYNSVGSQEGWQPSTFKSSRDNRASSRPSRQRPEDFMDEEDGLLGRDLHTQLPYDTLGVSSKQLLRKEVEKEAVGSSIPGLGMVDELLVPTEVAIGKKLLQMMGWKEGVGVGSRQRRPRKKRGKDSGEGEAGVEEAVDDDVAFLPEHLRDDSTLVQQGKITFARPTLGLTLLPRPKNDRHGLGFDPEKDAPELAAFRRQGPNDWGGEDDSRGVYRMGDVLGKDTSSRAGRRNASGFALDEDEDDVYDQVTERAGQGERGGREGGATGKEGGRESMYLSTLGEPDDEEEESRSGQASTLMAGAAKRVALEAWISGGGGGGRGAEIPGAVGLRCPTDSRPVLEGFVLGVKDLGYQPPAWPLPTPPRGFVPYHSFETEQGGVEGRGEDHAGTVRRHRDANQGRLRAETRGGLLGEAPVQAAAGTSSIFDLMSEADRARIETFKTQGAPALAHAAASEAAESPSASFPPVPSAFQGMQGALAKRFSVAEKPATTGPTLPEGLTEGGKGAGGIAPSVALAGPALPKVKTIPAPARSQVLFQPVSLLCKRFNVSVPGHARLTPAISLGGQPPSARPAYALPRAFGGGRAEALKPPPVPLGPGKGKAGPVSLLSNKFDREMEALLPGENLVVPDVMLEDKLAEGEIEEEGRGGGSLPAFEQKPRPSKDLFKAIFEAPSSSESEEESEEEEEPEEERKEEGEKMQGQASEGILGAQTGDALNASTAGDASTNSHSSTARDHFLQPAQVAGLEAMEDLLAKGPMLLSKKRKALKEDETVDGGDEEEEEEGLVFGSGVLKKPKLKSQKGAAGNKSEANNAALPLETHPSQQAQKCVLPTSRSGDLQTSAVGLVEGPSDERGRGKSRWDDPKLSPASYESDRRNGSDDSDESSDDSVGLSSSSAGSTMDGRERRARRSRQDSKAKVRSKDRKKHSKKRRRSHSSKKDKKKRHRRQK
ncbi:g patch domain-containing protein 1 [Nannochloropsis gaditana]|uniref:G patch domain-containing protein 1 n=2 Tax=Nannochloropsis gaditana TaxID=72520 RepID=W7TGR7_9STRA|nr:g patch domain-containing protein 1 [Nannochloropsis gaditana]